MKFTLKVNAWIIGLVAAVALFSFYAGVLTIFNGFEHAVVQLQQYLFFIGLLVIGFGIQAGMMFYLHKVSRAGRVAKTTGAMSAGAMIACCAHHVTDVAPFLGLSVFSLFLSDYQEAFMIFGVLSNFVGITFMLKEMKRIGVLKINLNMNNLFKGTATASIILFFLFMINFKPVGGGVQTTGVITGLQMLTNSENGITFDVTPRIDDDLRFTFSINNHQVALDFDLTKTSELIVNNKTLEPKEWIGTPMGTHHANGELIFDKPSGKISFIQLKVNALGTIRIFNWTL